MTNKRIVKFFDITGKTLVHPMSYNMQEFQKRIISSAVSKNTLISLPPGLGMPFLSSILVLNFHRWFLNGKIIVLSQNKNYINEQISAYQSYTTLPENSYCDLHGNAAAKEGNDLWNKPIVLTSPFKLLDNINNNNNNCSISNLILLVVYETNKIAKCQEYKNLMNLFSGIECRIVVFVDGYGFNAKNVKQIVDIFNISQLEIRKLSSPDIKECTYFSEIESVALDISSHMNSIKDAFFAVYEKYGKLLKDSRLVNGNIASFTKLQIQKAKEKLIKTPPLNMTKQIQQNLLDSMTMCSFLCTGIEILHNWGVRSFYNYLFDQNKESDLKKLIAQDEHLKNQMKLLNEYLKSNGKKIESLMTRIIHPKLVYLKNMVTKHFTEAKNSLENVRVVVYCSMEEIVDDIDRLLSSLPDYIRHQCVKTKMKCLSNVKEYEEVIQNFNAGVINILVVSNLVEEINDLRTDMIVSLEPNKHLLKFSDPRFHKGADKCFFILTKGSEYTKFESMLHEKQNEQKTVDIPDVRQVLKDSLFLFPEDFNPEFESSSVMYCSESPKKLGQKSMKNYLNSKPKNSRKSYTDESNVDQSVFAHSSQINQFVNEEFYNYESISKLETIEKTHHESPLKQSPSIFNNEFDYSIGPQPTPEAEDGRPFLEKKTSISIRKIDSPKNSEYDSFDELLSHFPEEKVNKVPIGNKPDDKEDEFLVFSDDEIDVNCKTNESNCDSFAARQANSVDDLKSFEIEYNIKMCNKLINLVNNNKGTTTGESVENVLSSTHTYQSFKTEQTSENIECLSPSILNSNTHIFEELNNTDFQKEIFEDFPIAKETKQDESKSRTVEIVNETPVNGIVSPILFSSRKISKKPSKFGLFSVKDQSSSIHFDSSLEIGTNSKKTPRKSLLNKEKTPEPQNTDNWDPDRVLFDDDDIFDDIAANLVTPQKESDMKTSTPLGSKSESRNESDSSRSIINATTHQTPIRIFKTENYDDSCRKKAINYSFFSNFANKFKERFNNKKEGSEEGNDSGDDFPWEKQLKPLDQVKIKVNEKEYPWMKKSPFNSAKIELNTTPDFKRPSPVLSKSKSRSITPSTPHSSNSHKKSVSSENTPELKMRRKFVKNNNLKRNLVEEFLDNEAEVSDDTMADDYSNISEDDCDSFIDDDPTSKHSNYSNYLKSMKSPHVVGKFKIPMLSESRLRMNVCSQMDDYDQTYENDSFCVDNVDDEPDPEYVPSVLTQMEDCLQMKRKKKKTLKRLIGNSSPNSPISRKKKQRKRIMYFSSSDSD